MASHRFETVLEAEGGGVFFQVPLDVPATFGKARAAFDGLSFTHQREYAERVAGAKRAATRRRRVDQAVQMLRDGRRHP
jgi:uncharacterized protein YdeI (YjbR/CyaY-like superfamily)